MEILPPFNQSHPLPLWAEVRGVSPEVIKVSRATEIRRSAKRGNVFILKGPKINLKIPLDRH
jgi:hypothetical protein